MKNIFKLGSVFMAIALLISTLLLSGVFASAEQKNLIINGDFSDGLNGWTYSSYEDDWSVSGGKLIALANHGSKDDSLSPSFTEALKGETTYTLHVDISDLSGACVLRVNLDNNHEIADSPITATGDYTFTTYASTDLFKIKVFLPKSNSGATATFDNFILVEGDKIESETTATGAATETTASASETEATVTETATSASATETATETATSASATETATETATEAEPTATGAEPTATEAEKEYHAIDSWSASSVGYTWLNPNNGSGQVQVYAHIQGNKGTWGDFATTWAELADNQCIEIVYTGTFAGVTKDAVSFDSRVWNETTKSNDFIVSASDNEIVVRLAGPLTSKLMDPNLGLFFAENSLTAISAMEDTSVVVTVLEEGTEPTEPTTESTEPIVDPTGTEPSESTPSQSETTPSESKTEPSQPSVILGDANGDGAVNMKDVLNARKYLAGIDTEIDMVAADVNCDGAVNMKDVLQLRKFLAGLIESFGE